MRTNTQTDTREVNSFEEYTLYSLDRSLPALLRMMEGSKQVANQWPGLPALINAASLCQEMAALASFQDTLNDVVGALDGEEAEKWSSARVQFKDVMGSMEDSVNLSDTDTAVHLFAVEIPKALNAFAEAIPGVRRHVKAEYMEAAATEPNAGREEPGKG